jgi:hypothetical protein
MAQATQEQRKNALRGGLSTEGLGARGVERLARNPGCQRLRGLTLLGISPATASSALAGIPDGEGQSPFAFAQGNKFEAVLVSEGARRLVELYQAAKRLPDGPVRMAISPLKRAPKPAERAAWIAETARLLELKRAGSADAPHLIIKPRLTVRVFDADYEIEPDALVASDSDSFYRVVEIKSYDDRGGKTDPARIRGACRQAAVGVVGLRQLLGTASASCLAACDLILAVPGYFKGSLREMVIPGEVDSLERCLARTSANALDELEALLGGKAIDESGALSSVPCSYRPECREHCALAVHCRREASVRGDPVLLGMAARELLAPAGTLGRAVELMRAKGAAPKDEREAQLQDQLGETFALYTEAFHG